jgi:hypothetical protein
MPTPVSPFKWAFSLKQQSDYGTVLPGTDITYSYPLDNRFIPDQGTEQWTNEGTAGKGHQFLTEVVNLYQDSQFKHTLRCSSFILPFLFGLAVGEIVSVQPDDIGAPNTWRHTIKPKRTADAAWNAQLPVTSIVWQPWPGKQVIFRDKLIKAIALSAQKGAALMADVDWIGSGYYETSSITIPEPEQVSFLNFPQISFDFGGTDLTAEVDDFKFSLTNNLIEKDYPGGSPRLDSSDETSPWVRKRLLKNGEKPETFDLSFQVFLDPAIDFQQLALDRTEKNLIFGFKGDLIEDIYYHEVKLKVPKCIMKPSKIAEKDGFFVWDVQTHILYDSGIDAPFEIEITNTTQEYLALPT